jgi:hypothetical protein
MIRAANEILSSFITGRKPIIDNEYNPIVKTQSTVAPNEKLSLKEFKAHVRKELTAHLNKEK